MALLTIRPGHPDFLDLPWERTIADWEVPELVDLPKGISRHQVRFLRYPEGVYVVKELPTSPARNDYQVLRALENVGAPAVRPVGLVEGRSSDPTEERSAALITAYEPYSFSYRELLSGPGFGPRRAQMLDAFANLLVQLHLARCFWGDCSLSNVLYRFDAEAIQTIMVDAETGRIFDGPLSDGQREQDLEIMIENVAGGMADIAVEANADIDDADLALGEDIADRYRALWAELTTEEVIHPGERFRVRDRIARLNHLGFDVEEVELVPVDDDVSRLRVRVAVGSRRFHATRLRELTGIDALEHQARQILSDLYSYQATHGGETSAGKHVSAIRWRVTEFEPQIRRLGALEGVVDPLQAYCDLLHHRFVMSEQAGRDVGTEAAFAAWEAAGRPGYPLG